MTPNQRAVMVMVKSEPGATTDHIAHQSGLSESKVAKAAATLESQGKVRYINGGWYPVRGLARVW